MAIVNRPTPCNPYFNSIPHFLENLNRENSQANMKQTLYKYETDCNQLSYEMYFLLVGGGGYHDSQRSHTSHRWQVS